MSNVECRREQVEGRAVADDRRRVVGSLITSLLVYKSAIVIDNVGLQSFNSARATRK